MPPARPETQPAKSVTSTEPSLAGPSVAERAARFLQTGKLDESIESEGEDCLCHRLSRSTAEAEYAVILNSDTYMRCICFWL